MMQMQSWVQKALYSHDLMGVRFLVMLFFMGVLSFSALSQPVALPPDITPSGGLPMPELNLITPDKQQVALKELQKPLMVVHFWATWCAPCVTELPALNKFANTYRSQGVSFVVVSLDNQDNPEIVKNFYKEHNITNFPIFFAKQSDVLKQADLRGLPTTLFVKKGLIVARADADVRWEMPTIADYVEQLVIGE